MSAKHESHYHVTALPVYYGVFAALVVGTGLTYLTAIQDFGWANTVIALVIACVKASLVIWYFMHVKYSSKLTRLFVVAGFVWFIIMIVFTMADFSSRSWKM